MIGANAMAISHGDDERILAELMRRYRSQLAATFEQVKESLQDLRLPSEGIQDLCYRHSLIFFATLESLGAQADHTEGMACGALLAYSLPFVAADISIDGTMTPLRSTEPLWSRIGSSWDIQAMTHAGYGHLARSMKSSNAVQWTAFVSNSVSRIMQTEAKRKWSLGQLRVRKQAIKRYWRAANSRLNGSGVGRLMIGLACIVAGVPVAKERTRIATDLGRVRQAADELLDIVEDVRAGIITLPIAYSLLDRRRSDELFNLIICIWKGQTDPIGAGPDQDRRLVELVTGTSAPARVQLGVEAILRKVERDLPLAFEYPAPLSMLFEHRWRQIVLARRNGLKDLPPPLSVEELLDRPRWLMPEAGR